ncbi:MAG: nitroreductase/quinone reductase family protein [Gaiellales bacterium]
MTIPGYAPLIRLAGRTRAFAWVGARVLPALDRPFRARRRSVTSFGTDFPLCYLTTFGRQSGRARTAALLYVADGERVAVIASNFGKRNHPAWSLNLLADPEAMLTIEGVERPVRARLASTDERERAWREALQVWPGYEGYRRRAGREIRVFVLEPRLGASAIDEEVTLSAPSPAWPTRYAAEAERLQARLGTAVKLEHIGSTAVPGLLAKPVIDIMVGVASGGEVAAVSELCALGYEDCGGPPDRRYLRLRGAKPHFNAQVVEREGPLWVGNLTFRDYLRRDPEATRRYADAKTRALRSEARLLGYSRLKAPTIEALLRAAREPSPSAPEGVRKT